MIIVSGRWIDISIMNRKKFNKVIDFAIKREKSAVDFYLHLKEVVFFKEKQELLDTLVEMEEVHIDVLESIRLKTMKNVLLPQLESLDVEEYATEEIVPSADMSYQDILSMAMQREEKSFRFYSKIASESQDPEIKKLFLRLAAEEACHKAHFEKLFDELIS